MKTILGKVFATVACAVMSVAGLSGIGALKEDVNAVTYYTPRLMVTGSEIDKDKVNAGDEFELKVHFYNQSDDTHLYNVKIQFTTTDNEIYPVSGTNVFYVDDVGFEESFDVSVKMVSRADLEEKPYTITVKYEFEDMYKEYFSDSSEIVVPIYQEPVLAVSDMKLTKSEILLDNKTSFSMKLNNMGKGNIYNVTVSVEGDMINNVDTVVGNLDKGANTSVDLSLKGVSAGSGDINIIVTYEGTDGEVYTIEKTMNLTVTEPAPVEEAAEQTASPSLFVVGGVIVAVVVVVIIIVNVVRKKKEKAYA